MKHLSVLLVDDDEDEYILLKGIFSRLPGVGRGYTYSLAWAQNYEQALQMCTSESFDVLLVDYHLGRYNGLDLMRAAEAQGCYGPFILLTGQGSYEIDLAAMQQGVADYLLKDQINEQLLERSIRYALERSQVQEELERRVEERTAELAHTNQELKNEIQRRNQAELELRRAKEELEQRVIERTAQIQASNKRLQTVLQALPVALVIADASGHITDANEAFQKLWDSEFPMPERLERWSSFQAWWSESGQRLKLEDWPLVRAVQNGEFVLSQLIDILTLTGNRRTLLVSAVPIFDAQGRVNGGVSISQDITNQRKLEQQAKSAARESRQRADELDGLHRATKALLSTLELDELLCQILDAAQSAIPAADQGLLYLALPATGQLQVQAALGFKDPRICMLPSRRVKTYPAQVVREHKPVLLAEVPGEDSLIQMPPEMNGAHSAIFVPLFFEEQVLGALALSSKQMGAFNESNMRLLASFAATTAAAMQNALLHAEVKQLAVMDPLTGEYNRRAFFDLAQREIERFVRFRQPLSAIMLDLDNFKQINDTYGHAIGDQILRILTQRCRANIREVDIFGRYGGDEFVLVLPNSDITVASLIANRIREAVVATPWKTEHGPVQVSISVGVAQAREPHRVLEDLLADADLALYRAKAAGRNRVEIL